MNFFYVYYRNKAFISMKYSIQILLLLFTLSSFQSLTFKGEQLRYARVRQAYKEKEDGMLKLLKANGIEKSQLQLYLRAFKKEKVIELWAKNQPDKQFTLIKTYGVCHTSGELGPKRMQGDFQIPEGFYHINRFNPYSHYYLSLGINYPNPSDKILGVKNKLGGDIFIHGSCVTIGCLPITNDKIKDLYVFCVEAKNNGQSKIPVTIFPSKLTESEYLSLTKSYIKEKDKMNLWADLKKAYEIFNRTRQLPEIEFLSTGRHHVRP